MGSQEISLIQGGGREDVEDNLLNCSDTMNFFKSKSAHKRTNQIRQNFTGGQNLNINELHHDDGGMANDLDAQLVIRLD